MHSVCGKIPIKKCDLNLKMMLEGGQCFRWKKTDCENEWIGVIKDVVWKLKQNDFELEYTAMYNNLENNKTAGKKSVKETKNKNTLQNCFTDNISQYLRLDAPLADYYEDWSKKDEKFRIAAEKFHGIRMLNQDPVENIFSFICSSNNNISRITMMIEKLCKLYGKKILNYEGQDYYGFPEVKMMSAVSVEDELRKAGFGYRAKFIQKSADKLVSLGGTEYLEKLKSSSYEEAKLSLTQFPGIGEKVADCICLMSLGHMEAVPVDTHVFQIASQFYLPHLKSVKTVTARVYSEIGNFFRNLYGPSAGWAHTILFCADLKKFQTENGNLDNQGAKKKRNLKRKGEEAVQNEDTSVSGILKFTKYELNLKTTLNCGQTYRWKEIEDNVWRGVFKGRVWTLRQSDDSISFNAVWNSNINTKKKDLHNEAIALLTDYFRLDEPLLKFYKVWASKDSHFAKIGQSFYGLRMTRQNIVENLFAFICSSNNTIQRITYMVEYLCTTFGEKITSFDGVDYYDFPKVETLAVSGTEEVLKNAGFGFRAKYIFAAAQQIITNGGKEWFNQLLKMSYKEAKKELMKLPGIGAKIADCICLTALDHLETIPVDTHVFQIAKNYYLPHLQDKKSISEKTYQEIGDCFRRIFGHYSGWAHTVLFCSDLKSNASLYKDK